MLICDLHCDLPDKVVEGKRISSNKEHWAEDKLKKENTYVQVFAHYVDKNRHKPYDRVCAMLKAFINELAKTDIRIVTTYKDLEKNIAEGKTSAILAIEGGEALDGKLENVRHFYNLGVRFLTLTWNYSNQLGQSSTPWCENAPLTEFGKQVIKEMNRLKMTPDVSHLSEKGFWSAAQISTQPIVATHSNSKKLCNHYRNLTDEQFLEIKRRGGLVGINYYPTFLEESGKANVLSIIKHIEHFMAIGGENVVSLGGDFDGIDALPEGMSDIGDVEKIAEELAKINYSDEIIAKIMGKNVKRYIKNNFL